jgi:hypothetical protein
VPASSVDAGKPSRESGALWLLSFRRLYNLRNEHNYTPHKVKYTTDHMVVSKAQYCDYSLQACIEMLKSVTYVVRRYGRNRIYIAVVRC